jgi:hypothetical protein
MLQPQEARRVEAKAKGEGRPGPSGQSGTAAVAAPVEEEASIRVHEGMSCGARGVLLDGDLLGCVWGFVLGGSGRQDVCVLGQLSVVCRKWREVSLWDAWWVGIKEDVLPLLWEEEAGRGKAGSSRGRVMGYGRFLEGQRGLVNDPESDEEWLQGLEAHVEIFDRMDGLQMLSMRGPVSFTESEDEDDFGTWGMQISSESPSFRGACAAFAAASRDPQRRFASIQDYLEEGHRKEYPCCLCMRVTLRDKRTGRMALIWEERKGEVELIEDEGVDAEMWCAGDWLRRGQQQNLVGRLVDQSRAAFCVDRVSDQAEDVSDEDVLYRFRSESFKVVFARYTDWESFLTMEQLKGALKAALISGGSR